MDLLAASHEEIERGEGHQIHPALKFAQSVGRQRQFLPQSGLQQKDETNRFPRSELLHRAQAHERIEGLAEAFRIHFSEEFVNQRGNVIPQRLADGISKRILLIEKERPGLRRIRLDRQREPSLGDRVFPVWRNAEHRIL